MNGQAARTGNGVTTKTRDAARGSEGAEGRRDRTPVVIVGGAVVGALDDDAPVADGVAVEKMRQRMAVLVDQRYIDIGRAGRFRAGGRI